MVTLVFSRFIFNTLSPFWSMVMFKKSVTFFSAMLVLTAIVLVAYGMRTTCEDVAVYVYCEESER